MNAKHFLDANNLLYSIGRDPGKTRGRHIAIELLDAALEIRAARRLAYRDRAIAAATGRSVAVSSFREIWPWPTA